MSYGYLRKLKGYFCGASALAALGVLTTPTTGHAIFTRCDNVSTEGGYAVNVEAVGDFDGDFDDDYAIVSQIDGDRRIQIHSSQTCDVIKTIIRAGSSTYGDSIASDDFDRDGHAELLIGEPGWGNQSGLAHLWDPDFNGGQGGLVVSFTNPTAQNGGQFGAAVAGMKNRSVTAAAGGRIYVGAPLAIEPSSGARTGAVTVYDVTSVQGIATISTVRQYIYGSQAGEEFGRALSTARTSGGFLGTISNRVYLHVGAPGFDYPNNINNAGIVQVYRSSSESATLSPLFTVNAVDGALGRFGASLDSYSTRIAIGAPGARTLGGQSHGAVYMTSGVVAGDVVRYYDGDASEIDNGIGSDVALLNDSNYDGVYEVAFGTKAGPFSVNRTRGIARVTQPGASFNGNILEAPMAESDNAVRIAAGEFTSDSIRDLLIARRSPGGGGRVQLLQLGGFANDYARGQQLDLHGSVNSSGNAYVTVTGAVPGQAVSMHGSNNLGWTTVQIGARTHIVCIDLSPGVYAGRTDIVAGSSATNSGTATYGFVLPRNSSGDFSNKIAAFQAVQFPFTPIAPDAVGMSNCVLSVIGLS